MLDIPRLTACASSSHPVPADAVGEVIGRLQDSLAGSPEFALALVDRAAGSQLSAIAGAIHHLLGPDLLLAVAGGHVAGGDRLEVDTGSVVVWSLCGVNTDLDVDAGPAGHSPAPLTFQNRTDGTVAATFRPDMDGPRPVLISGDGQRRRLERPRIIFPTGSATVLRVRPERSLGGPMIATEAHGRTLGRLDHVAVRAVLLDRLETTDAVPGGPSSEFPPLRIVTTATSGGTGERRTIEIVAVDPETGGVELSDVVDVGDEVQLLVADPDAPVPVLDRWLTEPGPYHRAALLDRRLGSGAIDLRDDQIATALLEAVPVGGADPMAPGDPWSEINALVVQVSDEP